MTMPIAELHEVDAAAFRQSGLTDCRPVVLRGLVRDWPVVREALRSPESAARLGRQIRVLLLRGLQRG